jgi:predicted DNA-binding transcriptional regulator YafY
MRSTYGIPSRPIIRKREFRGKPINNTRRVERVLKLIKFLSEFRTIREINKHLEIHEKSVQRYLNLMVQLGFDVEVRMGKYHSYRITNTQEYFEVA